MSKLRSIVAVVACSLAITFVAPAISVLVLPLVLSAAPAWAEGTPVRVRGTVVSLDGSKLVVRAKDGKDVTVSLKDKYAALAVVKSSMEDIKQGTFIGTATVAQPDGSLRALEVVVFPESLRGFGEGHYPWDLGPSSMMTNATIANKVQSTDGQTVTVTIRAAIRRSPFPPMCQSLRWFPLTRATSCRARLSLFLPKNKPTVRCSAAPFCSAKMA